MLVKLTVRNFKRFNEIEIDLGNPVVFVGPNNSGKTSAMQALALWDIGVKRWSEKRAGQSAPERRPGVAINRRDALAIPHPSAKLLWRNLRTRDVRRVRGSARTSNVRIDIVVQGIQRGKTWRCGLEFDYANEESLYCRPLRLEEGKRPARMPVPKEAASTRVVFLPPLSGLAAVETRLDQGAVDVRIGEGRTAEVLRNLCLRISERDLERWELLKARIKALFGVELEEPRYFRERGEITLGYRERGAALDLSSAGRGLQQTLLILAYMHANPGAVVLLDEPDAGLEIIRQRQIYGEIAGAASESGSQIIAATHSEALLNEAAGKDVVISFVGAPHRIDRPGQTRKALAEISADHYLQAEQTGWVLYLEGSTDLAILQAFARRLANEEAAGALEKPFVHYVGNRPSDAMRHFYGLREALPDLKGVALFDRLDKTDAGEPRLQRLSWKRRETENYLCSKATLEAYARASAKEGDPAPLFAPQEEENRLASMRAAISEVARALRTLKGASPWDQGIKASDEVLKPILRSYFRRINLPNLLRKKSFHELADFVPAEEIAPEVAEKLDAIAAVQRRASHPLSE